MKAHERESAREEIARQLSRRRFLQRAGISALALPSASALLAACSGGSSGGGGGSSPGGGGGSPRPGGHLIVARTADSLTMDKTAMFDNESIWIVCNLYEMLYEAGPDGKTLLPWLATGHDLSDDKLTWTFHLRPGVKFHNGQPMTADDVVFSIDEARGKDSAWGFIYTAVKDVSASDPQTVVIQTSYPWAPLLADVALFGAGVVPKDYGGASKKDFYAQPVGTGPFQWDSWSKGSELRLKKNASYWQEGKPYLDAISWNNVPDDNTRILQVKGGQAHIDEFPPWSAIDSLKSAQGVVVKLFPSSRTDFLSFNQKRQPFQDVHVRRAIAYAIDREAMVKAVLFGNGRVANSFLTPALFGYDPNVQMPEYSVDKAKQELAQSSVPDGFKTTLQVGSGVVIENSLGQIVQQQLGAIGIHVDLKTADPNAEFTNIQNFDYDMCFLYDTTDIIDPDELVNFSVAPSGGTYAFWTNYQNPQVDEWTKEGEREFEVSKRQALYSSIQKQVATDVPLAPLYYSPFPYAYSDKVQGFQVYPTGNYHAENIWLTE
jgi:peptide/nickel transport system substrate-binding protein